MDRTDLRDRLLLGFFAGALAAGCESQFVASDGAAGSPEVSGVDVPDLPDAGAAEDAGPVDLETEVEITGCPGAKGCPGDPCTGAGDCLSGPCVEHLGDGVCTSGCDAGCPPGWSCLALDPEATDPAFACVSDHPTLCDACEVDGDCQTGGAVESVCLDRGPIGRACASKCASDSDCPDGFGCVEETVAGVVDLYCLPVGGSCPCSPAAVAASKSIACSVTNDLGTCPGARLCAAEGLLACDAASPAAEACNGLDDDCDGETDEEGAALCDDGNPCTIESCAGAAGCEAAPSGTDPCDDASVCTVSDFCQDGSCLGTPISCDDDEPCTDDGCDPGSGCVYGFVVGECDDGEPCTLGDHCDAGGCKGVPVACECQIDADCAAFEDEDLCNGTLRCDDSEVPFRCVVDPATVVVCPKPTGVDAFCLEAVCGAESGLCGVKPDHEGAACSDGDDCTVGDACDAGQCAGSGPADCDDGNPCTADTCLSPDGCAHFAAGGACDDGNSCTEGDHCASGECVAEIAIPCDDGDPCTFDTCDLAGGCVHGPKAAPCEDGNPCTGGDTCSGGGCVPGPAVVCKDGNPCTDDSCAPATGCVFSFNGGGCDDGNACTLGDKCFGGKCTSPGTLACDDGNPCTTDACEPAAGCTHADNSLPCEDGTPCTLGDTCKDGACTSGAVMGCDDGNPCTADECHLEIGCVHPPGPAVPATACDDGNPCTAVDACAGGACKGSGTISCDDGDPCTTDFCESAVGCAHGTNKAPCDDGDPCSVGDTCADGACVPGPGGLLCFDGDPCTADTCDPETGCSFPVLAPCCGNLQVDLGESCDDGDQDGGDGCSADCKSDESCGNGILDPATEVCDTIHFPATCHSGEFTCAGDCQTWDTASCSSWCGDGVIDPKHEACDDGVFPLACTSGSFECLFGCKVWDKSGCAAYCGDGVVQGDEECDGDDFAVPCPLGGCACSSDCKVYVETISGADGWLTGTFDGVSNTPANPVDEACADPANVCLDSTQSSLAHLWIANSNEHEVVKIDVDTGAIEAEVSSHGQFPSRTAVVVSDRSVWVGNRGWNCTGNPTCSNLVHLDEDGKLVCRADILGMVRAVGIDAYGDVWAGSWEGRKAYKVSGTEVDTGQDPPRCKVLAEVPTAGCPYGMAGDSKGNLWVANNCNWASSYDSGTQSIQRIDAAANVSTGTFVAPPEVGGCFQVYGLTVDNQGRVIVGSHACWGLHRYDPEAGSWQWISTAFVGSARGVVVDQNGFIYTAISNGPPGDQRHVVRVTPDFLSATAVDLGGGISHPVGVAIDRNGWLWTAGRNSASCARVNLAAWDTGPTVNVFPTNGSDPYTYSDMTGFQHLLFTNPEGTWTKVFDGGAAEVFWMSASWTGLEDPPATDLSVRARAAASVETLAQAGWTAFISASPADLEGLPNLRYMELQVKLSSTDNTKTPLLSGVTVHFTK